MASKKLTWNNMDVEMREDDTVQVELDPAVFGTTELKVKRTLSMDEMTSFVNDVVAMCVDEGEAVYYPELFDFAVRLCTMTHYAGIPMPSGSDEAVLRMTRKAYRILYKTNLFESVLSYINRDQYDKMVSSAETGVHYVRDLMVSAVARKTAELIAKMDEVVGAGTAVLDSFESGDFARAVDRLKNDGVLEQDKPVMNDSIAESITADNNAESNIVLMKPRRRKKS